MQSIEERAAAAYELKATGKCNCAQSVVKVFQDKLPVGEDTLMKLTAGYAAGMGCMESTCGALIGAVMVAGILTDGKATPRTSKELLQKFEAKCGATICKDLKGVGTGKPLCPCPECVRNAVLALGEVFPD
jgi:C_GCAxxG_C_C family probable redox protein